MKYKHIIFTLFCLISVSIWPQNSDLFSRISTDSDISGLRLVNDHIMPDPDSVAHFRSGIEALFSSGSEQYKSVPFRFEYGGISSRELLPTWRFEKKEANPLNTIYSWTDPVGGLKVEADVRWFEKFAAADWVLKFSNTGNKNSALLENVRIIDLNIQLTSTRNQPNIINTLHGDNNSDKSWLPVKYALKEGESKHFAPIGGRSSNGVFPFWNIQKSEVGDRVLSEGMFLAIGWSGQWVADFSNINNNDFNISAGMEELSTILYPGESIRQPRVLIMPWASSRIESQVLFRRLLMFEYTPKADDQLPIRLPMAGQCFDRYYYGKLPGWETYKGQVAWAKKIQETGLNAHWFDAAWFPVGFPNGVGNWFSDTVNFPQGVEALGKAVHDLGMKFILWFEPERVAKNTQIANEHPEYVFAGEESGFVGGYLFKLNDPEARAYLTDILHDRIKRYGVDVLRIDYNINPLPYWRANDMPTRRGMTEIRYVEGHYEMWNKLREGNPGLWIDNCASGGRRIDLETTSISIPLWRSDISCRPGRPDWQQTHTLGIAQYIPLFSCASWESDPYNFRSAANMGMIASFNFMDEDYDLERAKAACNEAKAYQKFWYGDFYPLTQARLGSDNLHAWQLHREDLNAGIIYIFRQGDCPYTGYEVKPYAIDTDTRYKITLKRDFSAGETRIIPGSQFYEMVVEMPQKQSSVVIEYRKVENN